ncbi:hypothetical protein K493DRAFT_310129 [Basidiobolus meristosporus CBS 931.73]|uniref:Uncharacterized protein n=1 Tax=Basidiobolus meristosporus CBS 931.73 TaxID=1314790 RepID=A0A1Y1ZCP2_9FUNG|nr:hypothetical protein K493DRAFT_310129 [Basidiobolus meristosporus CBS 931.73]|eukprot:ORY07585.1 hypothetical protein K493DRAFT_310129 [Basidiobolus meristosporus CBS 931.73]
MLLRSAKQFSLLKNLRPVSSSPFARLYTSISPSSSEDVERISYEQEHHNYLVDILRESSEEDWSSQVIQNHLVSAPTLAPMNLSQDALWDDLIQD